MIRVVWVCAAHCSRRIVARCGVYHRLLVVQTRVSGDGIRITSAATEPGGCRRSCVCFILSAACLPLTVSRLLLAACRFSFIVQHRHADCFFERVNKANTDKGRPRPITMVRKLAFGRLLSRFSSHCAIYFRTFFLFFPSVIPEHSAVWCLLRVALRKEYIPVMSVVFGLDSRRTFLGAQSWTMKKMQL